VTPEASFGFHQALRREMTKLLWSGYPADIRAWMTSRGGLPPPRTTLVWMWAPRHSGFSRSVRSKVDRAQDAVQPSALVIKKQPRETIFESNHSIV
jgi:hypothetical protein